MQLLREGGGGLNVKDLMLAYICINAAVAIISYIGVFEVSVPYLSPLELQSQFSLPSSFENVIEPTIFAAGGVISILLGYGTAGVAILIIAALNLFWTPAKIVVGGFGTMLGMMGVPTIICQIADAFSAFIWMVFIVEYLGGRRVE